MWLFTKQGMISVVRKDGTPERPLCVRSRVRKDLVKVLNSIGLPKLPIVKNAGTDYPFRTFLSPEELTLFMSLSVDGLDYNNFKDTVPYSDTDRHSAYMGVWSSLLRMEEATPAVGPRVRGLVGNAPGERTGMGKKGQRRASAGVPQSGRATLVPKRKK